MTKENKQRLAIIILAAGKGKRMMNPDLPKALAPMAGKPLLRRVLDNAFPLDPEKIVLVAGHKMQVIVDFINSLNAPSIRIVEQAVQLGTGHAAAQAAPELAGFPGNILILCGDVPLLRTVTLKSFIDDFITNGADVSVLSADAPDPTGYGRIVRDNDGALAKIVEEKDASDEERKITEFNSGVFLVRAPLLFDALAASNNDNAQGEYYLTDIIGILRERNKKATAFKGAGFDEVQGVNSPEQLKKVELYFKKSYT